MENYIKIKDYVRSLRHLGTSAILADRYIPIEISAYPRKENLKRKSVSKRRYESLEKFHAVWHLMVDR